MVHMEYYLVVSTFMMFAGIYDLLPFPAATCSPC